MGKITHIINYEKDLDYIIFPVEMLIHNIRLLILVKLQKNYIHIFLCQSYI